MSALALGVPLTVISVLGLLLNGYILLVVVLTKQVQTANNLLLLHLGIVDSLLCVVFLLFSAPALLRGGGSTAQAGSGAVSGVVTGPLCAIHGFLFTLLHPVALWTVCGLNCDRYYAISAPLHYTNLVSTRKVAACLGASWILALTMALPPLFLSSPGYRYISQGASGCAPHFTAPLAPAPLAAVWYSGLYTALTLLLPAALILGCNLKVLMIARYHRHRIASAIYEVTLSAQVTITHQRNPFYLQSQFRGRSAVVSVLQLLGSLLFLYFPYYGVIVWEAVASTISGSVPDVTEAPYTTTSDGTTSSSTDYQDQGHQSSGHVHPHVVSIAAALLTCSPPINGFIYGVKSKVLRKTFANFWRKQMTKSEVNHEIQARTPSACGSRRPSLTPMGILGRPPTARRLSEVLLEPSGRFALPTGCSPHRPRLLKRMATELSWRPALLAAATSIDLDSRLRRSRSVREEMNSSMRRNASCNTLQVPGLELPILQQPSVQTTETTQIPDTPEPKRNVSPPKLRPSASAACLLVQRVLLAPKNLRSTAKAHTPPAQRRSPQILITRAFSQDRSEGSLHNSTPYVFRSEQSCEDRNDDQTCSSTAALLPDTCSSPESPEPLSETTKSHTSLYQDAITDDIIEKDGNLFQNSGQRVCFSLDDVSGGQTSQTSNNVSPVHQPASLPAVPLQGKTPSISWFRTLQNTILSRGSRAPSASSNNLMSWPLRADLSRRSDLAVAKSCSDVTSAHGSVI